MKSVFLATAKKPDEQAGTDAVEPVVGAIQD